MLICDFHVHLYCCFGIGQALDAAHDNMSGIARSLGAPRFEAVLFLAETANESWFAEARNLARLDSGWQVCRTDEAATLCLVKEGKRMYIVRGWQIVTRERLEFLLLGGVSLPEKELSLSCALDQARAEGALPVVPWGAGKWLGQRGQRLAAFLDHSSDALCLGDNGGRPLGWGESDHFQQARQRGLPILPGSDPLPLAQDGGRIGSYCGVLEAELSSDRVLEQIHQLLLVDRIAVTSVGSRVSPFVFFQHQVQLRMRR